SGQHRGVIHGQKIRQGLIRHMDGQRQTETHPSPAKPRRVAALHRRYSQSTHCFCPPMYTAWIVLVFLMSSKGLLSRTIRSACLPFSKVPKSLETPRYSAAFLLAL